ncbi:GNAT family N-acetyltransferase [Bacillus mesophilum]|uniref:GNAT family N-acetyltransferase n=1 Tax=Bacillus mesophilum TaxID=1071718 RepID=A0A7V7RRD0_9BACI|nr:GNAT family N-acetyltransferase [Bacillus mesophilum]KAB2335572.1 GNAT family N-acetyltransferase [Bacillus mesophilum]
MSTFKIHPIENLSGVDIDPLLEESKEEGFHFLERLKLDYIQGTNTFNKPGECLYGVFNEKEELIAIGGLNINPITNDKTIGRVRRFYVSREYRKKGIGSLVLKEIITAAKIYFKILVLYTDTTQAGAFYLKFGFISENKYPNSTHFLKL